MANLISAHGKSAIKCHHKNRILRVISVVVTCEKTAIYCTDCGEILTEPTTDCR